jgi:hypothetical protein
MPKYKIIFKDIAVVNFLAIFFMKGVKILSGTIGSLAIKISVSKKDAKETVQGIQNLADVASVEEIAKK